MGLRRESKTDLKIKRTRKEGRSRRRAAVAVSGGLQGGRRNRTGKEKRSGKRGGGVRMKKEKEGVGIYIYVCVKITTKYPIIHSELYF